MEPIFEWVSANILQILVITTVFIQIAPIKWNPITAFVSWFGKLITADVSQKIDELAETVDNLQNDVYSNEKDRIRWEILDFANSCHNGKRHTKDEFEHIIKLNTKYRTLLTLTNDENGIFDIEYDYINQLYKKISEKNAFLPDKEE